MTLPFRCFFSFLKCTLSHVMGYKTKLLLRLHLAEGKRMANTASDMVVCVCVRTWNTENNRYDIGLWFSALTFML